MKLAITILNFLTCWFWLGHLAYGQDSALNQIDSDKIRPLREVISKDALEGKGLFTTYLEPDKLYFVIPEELLGKDMIVARAAEQRSKVIRWKLKNNSVFLEAPELETLTGTTIPAASSEQQPRGVKLPTIIKIFPVLAVKNKSIVIEVSGLFKSNVDGFLEQAFNFDPERSFIEELRNYPEGIEMNVVRTTMGGTGSSTPVTIRSHWSIALLPEPPMKPRLYDHRMGFARDDSRHPLNEMPESVNIIRFRLEKRHPKKKLSEPLKPIIFYLDPQIPEKWKKYIKAGIYQWLPAFETAGFKNAIVVKDQPVGDPEWDVDDIRYNVVRWIDHTKERQGRYKRTKLPGAGTVRKILDPRTGEVLKGDIIIGPYFDWTRYFIRTAHLIPGVRKLPLDDKYIGRLITSVSAHEAGHVFGLRDGSYGKFAYSLEKVREKEWLERMGHTPSIMNYTREDYLVQPKDSIPEELLNQKVGPADHYSIKWGYLRTPYSVGSTEETKISEALIAQQDSIPYYRFANTSDDAGPDNVFEVVETTDPVATAKLGLDNLKIVMDLLPEIEVTDGKGDYYQEHLYFAILEQWIYEMKHVASMVGGVTRQYKKPEQEGVVYKMIPGKDQKEAIQFLNKNAFKAPKWLVNTAITRRFESEGTLLNISSSQNMILAEILDPLRFQKILESELSGNSESVYTREELLMDLRKGIWNDFDFEKDFSIYEKELQQSYLLMIEKLLKAEPEIKLRHSPLLDLDHYQISEATRGIIIAELKKMKSAIDKTLEAGNRTGNGHLEVMNKRIAYLLDFQE